MAACAIAITGCASPTVDAQWTDPQAGMTPLRGARVLVVCEATEVVLSRICLDRLSAELQARGATVLTRPDAEPAPADGRPHDDSRYVALARTAGASAVWAASVGPDSAVAYDNRSGAGVSIGLGGFSFGRGGGLGVGVSVPIVGGGASPAPLAANARVTDTASGRLLWTARAGSPPNGDARSQLDNLLQRLVSAAGDAQLF